MTPLRKKRGIDGLVWNLADVFSQEQAEEIPGLLLSVYLGVLVRTEAGRIELIWVSDPNDVVEETEEEEMDKWSRVFGAEMLIWTRIWTHLVTAHPNWLVWYAVLMGMHPNSVTVVMYFPVGTNESEFKCSTRRTGGVWTSACSLTSCFGQVSDPGVDKKSLSGSGWTSEDGLPQQRGAFRDGQGLEFGLQLWLLACFILSVNLVHDALKIPKF